MGGAASPAGPVESQKAAPEFAAAEAMSPGHSADKPPASPHNWGIPHARRKLGRNTYSFQAWPSRPIERPNRPQGKAQLTRNPCVPSRTCPHRLPEGWLVVEGTRLESVRRLTPTAGSNPAPSAISTVSLHLWGYLNSMLW